MRLLGALFVFAACVIDVRAATPLVVHVTVALCDNEHQGIVPVPRAIGNGKDPRNNLYWGADFGVKSWLLRHEGWQRVAAASRKEPQILERLVAKKVIAGRTVYIIADAWDGAEIRAAIENFLQSSAGIRHGQLKTGDGVVLGTGGVADVVAYVGHNGLMDFASTAQLKEGTVGGRPRSIVLACASQGSISNLSSAERTLSPCYSQRTSWHQRRIRVSVYRIKLLILSDLQTWVVENATL